MKKILIIFVLASCLCNAALSTIAFAQDKKPETPRAGKDEYFMKLDEVIVIGKEPYWRKETPRWDRSKIDLDLKFKDESQRQLFPSYTTEEADEAMKPHDSNRNNAPPKIKLFDKKF